MTLRAAAAALLLAACRPAAVDRAAAPLQEMEDLVLRQSDGGRPAWILRARRATLREADRRVLLETPRMEFLSGGRVVSRVSARRGELASDTHDVRLTGEVVLDSVEEKARLSTRELTYSSARRLFETEEEVAIRRPGAALRGRGLRATPDLSEIRVFRQRTVVRDAAG